MTDCLSDEKNISSEKLNAKFGISIISIIYFVYILFIIGVILAIKQNLSQKKNIKTDNSNVLNQILNYIKSIPKNTGIQGYKDKTSNPDTFLNRFTEWFTRVGNSINSGSV